MSDQVKMRTGLTMARPDLFREAAYIAGEWIVCDGDGVEVRDPFDGALLGHVPNLGPVQARAAIDKAREVQREWSGRTVKERARILRAWYDLVVANADDLAQILTAEQGKPLAEAKGEILANAGYLEWYSEEAKRIDGDVLQGASLQQRILVLKQPVGVCAAITPWNFPNGMITRKVGPALAAGCAIILKPAAQTPFSALALAALAEEAGVPKGAFSVITGDARPIGEEFCDNPAVAKITFTGSTAVGRWLMARAGASIKRLSLELGGNSPFIIFDDADLDRAVNGVMDSKFRNSGQTCVCANRIFVQETVADAFLEKLDRAVGELKLGRGTCSGVTQGPLIDECAVAKVEQHVSDALEKGARIVRGGKRSSLGGTFYEPTILADVNSRMLVTREETFGPLAPVIPFKTENDVIAMANDTEYGLASYFYSRDIGRVWRVSEALQCGIVGVNTGMVSNERAPFGGVKQSGLGREGSKYGIHEFLDIKYVCLGDI
jgi:succinate-semialdehyde dehydrogenase/glutarate-semialdehyde dehydrogenase